MIDAQVGRILETLDRLNLSDNTFVVYTTDHGDTCGGHGMIDKHFIMYDDVVHVPLIARFPDRLPAGCVCNSFSSHAIDLATTFCNLAGLDAPPTFEGKNLLDMALNKTGDQRQDIFSMYQGSQFGLYTQRMLRDRKWKYIWNCTAQDELYDMENDPAEICNLASRNEYKNELQRLRSRLIEWMDSIKDPMLNQWTRRQLSEGLK